MKPGKSIFWITIFLLISGVTLAEDRYVRLRMVEGEVNIYSPSGQGSVQATMNTPIMDGDEIQTGDGRAELSFRNGIIVRIADNSAVRVQSSYTPMNIDLLQGTVFLDSNIVDRFRDELQLRAGDAQVYLIDEGNIRVDLGEEGSARITTIEGRAEVQANGQRVLLNPGERTYVDPGQDPERPERYAEGDQLDDWNASAMDQYAQDGYDGGYYGDQQYVDEDIYYDSYDLDRYGDWRYEENYGNVWVPRVGYGWQPYHDGRWHYASNSWFWVSYEPWGWAPYHYGRWGWSFNFGWYWIPGNVFAPAWVSWYSYGDYVGWCPLNYYNYPVYYHGYNGYNNFHPIYKNKTLDQSNSWTFVKKDELGSRDIKRKVLDAAEVKKIKIERGNVTTSPRKELVNYVIPKTQQSRGFVNDKRTIKSPEDIKNPVGVQNKEEVLERGKNTRDTKSTSRSKDPVKVKPNLPDSKSVESDREKFETSRPNSQNKSSKPVNRDSQFRRNDENTRKYYSPYMNPYFKGRDSNQKEEDSRLNPYYRDSNPSKNSKDANPRYLEEARKYFERFDQRNRPSGTPDSRNYDSNRPEPKSYERPDYSQRPAPKSYEAPRNYKAPETRRPEVKSNSSSRSSSSNSTRSSKPSSSNSNNNRKPRD